jgi:hypothetical protein
MRGYRNPNSPSARETYIDGFGGEPMALSSKKQQLQRLGVPLVEVGPDGRERLSMYPPVTCANRAFALAPPYDEPLPSSPHLTGEYESTM